MAAGFKAICAHRSNPRCKSWPKARRRGCRKVSGASSTRTVGGTDSHEAAMASMHLPLW